MRWEETLWAELDSMTETEQFVATGEMIATVNQSLLPALADRRRDIVNDILAKPDWDATKLAESTGARRGTILRLAQEGRARRREAA
jgi:hypothetical protein